MIDDTAAVAIEAAPALRITRVIKAPRQRVFDAFTKSEQLRRWWGPENHDANVLELDVRPGGAYRIEMTSRASGGMHVLVGTYIDVSPPERLSFTWAWSQGDTPGPETRVELEFHDVGEGTELRLVHSGLPNEHARAMHEEGWESTLRSLETYL